ncbi:MAG: hypothetical protein KF708_17165 [Pirellulales bacterium]|nr:hypothetical protein [Pirellulales bacterium]
MTLEVYDPEKLDQWALRVLDVAANLRHMANQCRENDLAGPVLHDKKASEWLAKLEQWSQQATAHVHLRAVQARAQRRAMASTSLERKPAPARRKSQRKAR